MSRNPQQPLRDYYADQSLDESALRRIHENATLAGSGRRRSVVSRLALAAALVLLLGLGGTVLWWQLSTPSPTERIDTEVRTNYAKDLKPEVRAGDFETLAAGLPRLRFALSPSTESGPLAGWRVEGGRYCSLAGELAAQVNLSDGRDRRALLYVVPLVDALREVEPGVRRHEETDIHIWRDAHRLYVQAIPKN